jgi:predicted transcriptional regulator
MATVTEKYSQIFSSHKQKPNKAAALLEAFFQERLNEVESQLDELNEEVVKTKKQTVH